MATDFPNVIARCLTYPQLPTQPLVDLVAEVLAMPTPLDRAMLQRMQERITEVAGANSQVALVYGGATKIKGYVFEAPKLPEIRGASALLDWVNEVGVNDLWQQHLPMPELATASHPCIIYASGGSFLAFAPAALGPTLATAVERCYTEQTLTANSAAVSASFSLLELRFGRNPLAYWCEDFVRDCADAAHRDALFTYYYLPEGAAADDHQQRFLNRKSFGELVTLLATMFNQRRDERASHGEVRYLPHYALQPWDVKCASSDVRPAMLAAKVGSDERRLSEPAARKLAAGRAVKGKPVSEKLAQSLQPWQVPKALSRVSWNQRWEKEFLRSAEGRTTPYADALRQKGVTEIAPADDLDQIGAASEPKRYIGLIYADGNNIGRLMATLPSPAIYQCVSQTLSDIAVDAVLHGLAQHLTPAYVYDQEHRAKVWKHPFEILAIGGDDLFIVVPGDRAFAVALTIAQIFEQRLTERFQQIQKEFPAFKLPDPARLAERSRYAGSDESAATFQAHAPLVGLSAGVVIAQESTPFFFLRDLVEELLKRAKGLAKEHAKKVNSQGQKQERFYGGAVDFMVLKSTSMVSDNIAAFRKTALQDHQASQRRLTARPYTWAEFAGLLASVHALQQAGMPRSQLYRLRQTLDAAAEGGILTSTMEYLYTRARLRTQVATALVDHIEHAWCYGRQIGSGASVATPPWSIWPGHGHETIWPDLLEAYDFALVGEAKHAEGAGHGEGCALPETPSPHPRGTKNTI
ncbi:Cas10/Cmr2 second palm domain-containing protein [Candidatus Viridilinea mediisalina]|uniref:Cas10/Cmr2 second palm domain-containing protein n=1 Tax=Candidatus Viridilinea mediisalina TaxID=2024553 RepID=A0A2A6RME6_9CHLR|nr:hydrolase [Candidatus Viridilinea mediisalina]PDW04095.1 hypothetical protein CJ255_05230 [Candidatus Viridilinea mediisalina]